MSTADPEWYCRIEGRVEGPFSTRALKTRAALGELIPTDEVREGLAGRWQPARFVQGLQFGSNVRRTDPEEIDAEEEPEPPRYRYRMIQIPPTIQISERTPKSTAAATYLESLVSDQAEAGWEFYRVDSIGVRVQPGCLGALLLLFSGQSSLTEQYYVVTFRRLA